MKRTPLKRKTPMKRGAWKRKEVAECRRRGMFGRISHPAKAIIGIIVNSADYAPNKKRKRLSPMSPRMRILRRIYLRLKAAFLLANPCCQFCGCLKQSVDVHHMKGRGKWYLVVEFFMAICRDHHDWIHAHPARAKEMGYLLKP